jgi:Fur family zinc uptake transcriptional regulator
MAHKSCESSTYYDDALEKMRLGGARITKPRQEVVKILEESSVPLGAQEILDLTIKKGVSVDLASVYRILHYLEELSLIHQVGHNGQFIKCAHNHCSSHIHVLARCKTCSQTKEISLPQEMHQNLKTYLQRNATFKLGAESISIEGICEDCK